MIPPPVRASLKALATMLFVAAWFAFPSWANDLPGQPRPEATASDWASALRASTLAQASRERSIQAELRRGLDRLTKSCVATGSPSVANPQPLKADLLEQELGDLDRLLNPLSERTNRLLGQAERRREQMCPALPLIPKSAACRIAEDRRDSLKQLSAALPAQRSDLLSRYNLYAEAGRLESKGCTSPGFTQRLLRADEQHMKPSIVQSLSEWVRLLDAAEVNN
jgi:hypothetical protein